MNIFGHLVTLGAVGVMEGGAVVVPGCDTARQDALDCASVKVCQRFE